MLQGVVTEEAHLEKYPEETVEQREGACPQEEAKQGERA
jgi:hypothetical protein